MHRFSAFWHMRLPRRLQGQKVKSQSHGAVAYCGGHLAAQLVFIEVRKFRTYVHSLLSLHTFLCPIGDAKRSACSNGAVGKSAWGGAVTN